ncbi:translation protein SH3-like domain-containing protein [Gloeopeniophorella convolvens]|nr:translation protein SH3-like domain-containing protein [Gloeopeniophorella convolvens]
MPHSFGYRARTRHMFTRGFKEHGPVKLSTFLIPYRVGDIVDIKANAAQQKGMPHKFYHGSVLHGCHPAAYPSNAPKRRTGIVYNVTPHAVGVIVNKVVGNRYIEKRVNIRVEHIRHSKCRQEFLDRVKRNHDAHVEAKAKGGMLLSQPISPHAHVRRLCRARQPEACARTPPRRPHGVCCGQHAADHRSCTI